MIFIYYIEKEAGNVLSVIEAAVTKETKHQYRLDPENARVIVTSCPFSTPYRRKYVWKGDDTFLFQRVAINHFGHRLSKHREQMIKKTAGVDAAIKFAEAYLNSVDTKVTQGGKK